MGDILLGALLGRDQSFERFGTEPRGWVRESEQASFFQVGSLTTVHSSPAALHAAVGSTGGTANVLRYDYGAAEDAHRVWFPDVTTHAVRGSVWARAGDAASSGGLCWRLGGSPDVLSAPIPHAPALAPQVVETQVASAAGLPLAGLTRTAAAMPGATVYLDDVLTVTDALTLHPGWEQAEREQAARIRQRTPEGRLYGLTRHRYPAFTLPLAWLTTQDAARVEWWWRNQLALALTLDTSDAAAVHLCQIVNARQPIGRRLRPYADRWSGQLELAGLHDGRLAF